MQYYSHCSSNYTVDESKSTPLIIYIESASEIPPVQNPSRSVYGQRPDIEKLEGALRKKAQGAIRQRRFRAKQTEQISRYNMLVKILHAFSFLLQ